MRYGIDYYKGYDAIREARERWPDRPREGDYRLSCRGSAERDVRELVASRSAQSTRIIALAKASNFVPGGGIWMNTERPEWNDANNALVGKGVSVVTTAYLHRYATFVLGLMLLIGVILIDRIAGINPLPIARPTRAIRGAMLRAVGV